MDKRAWDPIQVITWLGSSDTRLQKCLVHIDKALSDPNLLGRDLPSLAGKIISMSAGLPTSKGRLELYRFVECITISIY